MILFVFRRLFQLPGSEKKTNSDNIFSWVHKEFKENDINATKHRLLCKLDDMSNGNDCQTNFEKLNLIFLFSSYDSKRFVPQFCW